MKHIKLYEQREPEHRVGRRLDGSVEEESWWLDDEKVADVTSQADFEAWQYLKSIGLV